MELANRQPSLGRAAVATLVTLLVVACAPAALRPAPEARVVTGMPLAAVAQDAGIRMVVEPGAWTGNPERLEREVLPLKVTIENDSAEPVRIGYEAFELTSREGVSYHPLPPMDISGSVVATADRPLVAVRIAPYFVYRGFLIAPWYAPYYYVPVSPWRYPWVYDPLYYDTYYPRWEIDLPTSDMLERALPEGVIEPGGRVTGFVYFPTIANDLDHVTFEASLSDGPDGERFAMLAVPFNVS